MQRLGILLSICILASRAHAAAGADTKIEAAETTVSLGVTSGYGNYEENLSPQDTESGALLGLTAGLSALRPGILPNFGLPDLYTDVTYDFSTGFTRYRGNLQDQSNTPYEADDNAYYNTAIVRLGAGAPTPGGREVIPYIAAGYQNWYRNIGGPNGIGEFYQAELVGGGLKLDLAGSPSLVLSAAAEGFAVVNGSVNVPSQNYDGTFGASAEERISLGADYRLTKAWHAFAGLGITHYEYTGSKPGAQGIYEPLSTTLRVDSVFGLAYGF